MMIHGDPEFVLTLHSVIEFIGTFAFALSGIRLAASKHYDWLGGFVCGVAVAIGGGTIRDVMLGVRPFWMLSPICCVPDFHISSFGQTPHKRSLGARRSGVSGLKARNWAMDLSRSPAIGRH